MIHIQSLDLDQPLMISETTKPPKSFTTTPGTSAVAKCFTAPERAS